MFRKSLVKMFEDKGLDCIFLETNMNMKKQYHMVYECIPLPKEVGDMAPIYFKVFIIVFTYIFIFYCIMVLWIAIFILIYFFYILTPLVAQMVKRLSTTWETWVRSLGWEHSLEKEMATHSSTLALKIPWTEELGAGYYPWGHKESGTTERLHFTFAFENYITECKY